MGVEQRVADLDAAGPTTKEAMIAMLWEGVEQGGDDGVAEGREAGEETMASPWG